MKNLQKKHHNRNKSNKNYSYKELMIGMVSAIAMKYWVNNIDSIIIGRTIIYDLAKVVMQNNLNYEEILSLLRSNDLKLSKGETSILLLNLEGYLEIRKMMKKIRKVR